MLIRRRSRSASSFQYWSVLLISWYSATCSRHGATDFVCCLNGEGSIAVYESLNLGTRLGFCFSFEYLCDVVWPENSNQPRSTKAAHESQTRSALETGRFNSPSDQHGTRESLLELPQTARCTGQLRA